MKIRTRGTGMRGRGVVSGAAVLVLLVTFASSPVHAQSLRGSKGTVDRQNAAARAHDFTFLKTPEQVRGFVQAGYLVPIYPTEDVRIKRIGFPYARPEVDLFIRRLGKQYHDACGEELVVTSLTRPATRQPRNASPRSVHPTGMAVDLRRSQRVQCRRWLEKVLLHLEARGVVEAVRESRPPHYHVAVFPKPYKKYVESLVAAGINEGPSDLSGRGKYLVRPGDSLWKIAQLHDTTIPRLRAENGLRSNRIYPGQELAVP